MSDTVIEMPTDLHTTNFMSPFELETSPSRRTGILRLTVDVPSSRSAEKKHEISPPRWNTTEFYIYYLVACITIPAMIAVPVNLSSTSNPNYPLFSPRLVQGWLFGRRLDNSDSQYRSFRNNLPLLSVLVLVFLLFKRLYSISPLRSLSSSTSNTAFTPFLVVFSILMLTGLHGTSILKIMLILWMNYIIAKSCKGSRLGPLLTWIFNGAILFANEIYDGYRYASIHPALQTLDVIEGFYPRWHVSFNITMLRLVSFNMDYYWAHHQAGISDTGSLTDKKRPSIPHSLETYSFQNYIAYVLYAPLYIAGPIITFNDFMWQLSRPPVIAPGMIVRYLIRFLANLLVMEFILHFMYVVAIKDSRAWQGSTPFELSMIGFFNLIVVWLKLLLPWRFFRLWALLDGIDPPENMLRCMVNNYSPMGFWRAWHRSYNLWIIRYIYIPLGGTKNVAVTSFLIFTFVALWHDLSFRLLAWGWLISVFILPELLARYLVSPTKYGDRPWYRHLCALGAVANMLAMVSANLVGFVIGTDGLIYLLGQLLSWKGLQFLSIACVCIFVSVQLMFEYREEEMRKGIYRRC